MGQQRAPSAVGQQGAEGGGPSGAAPSAVGQQAPDVDQQEAVGQGAVGQQGAETPGADANKHDDSAGEAQPRQTLHFYNCKIVKSVGVVQTS